MNSQKMKTTSSLVFTFLLTITSLKSQDQFNVVGFYTARDDRAHISFVHEANKWFSRMAMENHFRYDSTNDWSNLSDKFLSKFQVIIFLDTRPDVLKQREAFERFMKAGGAWMGFHFSAFALTSSDFPQNWDWYHNEFI